MTYGFYISFLVAAKVAEHADHVGVWRRIAALQRQGGRFGLTPPVLTEFVHIVSHPRRFASPLSINQALAQACGWWELAEVDRIATDHAAVDWFLRGLAQHRLGRKRVLDTMLAATYRSAGVTSLPTLNPTDFSIFGEFSCFGP